MRAWVPFLAFMGIAALGVWVFSIFHRRGSMAGVTLFLFVFLPTAIGVAVSLQHWAWGQ